MKNAAMIANATLRHKFGINTSYRAAGPFQRKLKSYFGRAISKAGLAASDNKIDLVTFKIDPKTPGFILDTEAFERDF